MFVDLKKNVIANLVTCLFVTCSYLFYMHKTMCVLTRCLFLWLVLIDGAVKMFMVKPRS